uniref:Uncharacterized protein n=1 Tax=Glossina palpalis gambiensis TaxID=67801 RepID=A0A1B0AUQ3_9MUSC
MHLNSASAAKSLVAIDAEVDCVLDDESSLSCCGCVLLNNDCCCGCCVGVVVVAAVVVVGVVGKIGALLLIAVPDLMLLHYWKSSHCWHEKVRVLFQFDHFAATAAV